MKESAGILLYKKSGEGLRVFLVHPGGPFWKDKEEGAWSIPKGEIDDGESDMLDVGLRELEEETGIKIDRKENERKFIDLGMIKLRSGKNVYAWACEGDWHGLLVCKSYVDMEFPARSGKHIKFPEVDKAGFFLIDIAKKKINGCQKEFIVRLEKKLT